METSDKNSHDRLIMDQIRTLLDEKRAFISVMNTGICIVLAQLFINSILIATSRFYEMMSVLHILVPFAVINTALLCLAVYLIVHSLSRIHRFNLLIRNLKKRNSFLVDLVD